MVTQAVITALYNMLYQDQRCPVGYALSKVYDVAAAMLAAYDQARSALNSGALDAQGELVYSRIAALDRQSIVILGDPTVTLAA